MEFDTDIRLATSKIIIRIPDVYVEIEILSSTFC